MGCIQSLAVLSVAYPPATYYDAYSCDANGSCGLLKSSLALMTNSNFMLDLATHQSLLTLTVQLFTGN